LIASRDSSALRDRVVTLESPPDREDPNWEPAWGRLRPSDLSEGKAGSVRGGDRLPWVAPKNGGEDNFTPLASLVHRRRDTTNRLRRLRSPREGAVH
jgi:hypothetical protein